MNLLNVDFLLYFNIIIETFSTDISFSAIPAKEGLQNVPSILFILSNRAEFRYIPKLTVYVHPLKQTND